MRLSTLDDLIGHVVDESARTGSVLRVWSEARALEVARPQSGMTLSDIAEKLFRAGVDARVAMEWEGGGREPRP